MGLFWAACQIQRGWLGLLGCVCLLVKYPQRVDPWLDDVGRGNTRPNIGSSMKDKNAQRSATMTHQSEFSRCNASLPTQAGRQGINISGGGFHLPSRAPVLGRWMRNAIRKPPLGALHGAASGSRTI